ncbi:MAG: serine/threonine protein kinase [Pirellulales bacterium]|nr:serine/threonine protein kinase [Pirellulales bacterium]
MSLARATPGYIGPFRLLNVVNTGQTSRIWQAYDDSENKMFGLKVLLEDFRRNKEHLAFLKQEWLVGGNLDHDRIIRIHSYAVDRGNPYLAMEWFPSPNLKYRMRYDYDRIEPLIPRIIEQMCEALGYLHGQGWVHRDVKPDNFLVGEDGSIKLIDFALAHRMKGGFSKLLGGRSKIQGTRSYMSPEQIRGGAVDGRSDLYSLGCTVFELLGQKLPFTGSTAQELLMKHLRSAPPPLESANRNVTPEFGELIRRTMAKQPASRPKSIEDFLTEVRMTRIFRKAPKQAGSKEDKK